MVTVLLVEDEPHQRLLYQMELEDAGYRVIEAGSGRGAVERAGNDRPDLVVLDLRMPDMDGIETLERLMGLNPRLPVVIHSAYETFKDNFMTWAADAYLVKSSDLEVLKRQLRQVVSAAKAQGRWPVWPEEG